jgi:multisubunit Na+/H+ antiporter MnhG subunit
MGLDIRIPIGLMFSVFGLILTAYGVLGDQSIYSKSLGVNVNTMWGAVLLLFGIVMLVLGKRGSAITTPAKDEAVTPKATASGKGR